MVTMIAAASNLMEKSEGKKKPHMVELESQLSGLGSPSLSKYLGAGMMENSGGMTDQRVGPGVARVGLNRLSKLPSLFDRAE